MSRAINLSEDNLRTDLNELSREIIHELYVLCRKAGIYAVGHPMVHKAVTRPFMKMQKLFGFKKYFSLVLTEGRLFANNILIPDSNSIEYIKEHMQFLEIETILFDEDIRPQDMIIFVDRFSRRLPSTDPGYRMDQYLHNHGARGIYINHTMAIKLFETGLRYRGDVSDNFTIRNMVANYFAGDLDLALLVLSSKFADTETQAREVGIDFQREIVNYILPEKFSQLQASELLTVADRVFENFGEQTDDVIEKLAQLVKSFDYHPKRDHMLGNIRQRLEKRGIKDESIDSSLSNTSSIKLEAVQTIDSIRGRIFSDAYQPEMYGEFNDAFLRLLRTRQMGKAASIAENLVENLASDTAAYRQHAVQLLQDCIKAALTVGEYEYLDVIGRYIQNLFTRGRETFEYSEVTIYIVQSLLSIRRYQAASALLNVLKSGRRIKDGVSVYDSISVKRIFDAIDTREIISRLVRELQQPSQEYIKYIHDILSAIQSEEVALQLSEIVAHKDRTVRQRCLKLLAELGHPAVIIFSEILRDELNFQREDGRRELPDKQWFLIRNSIFVLGNLKDCEACNALRLRLTDPDVRVRTEIVRALEKIGGDEAVDLLMILAEDRDTDIREMAIITLGTTRRDDLVPFYIDLLKERKTEIARLIHAISLSGSVEGRDYLAGLLQDEDSIKSLASGKASASDIREMLVQALSRIGDDVSLQKLRDYEAEKADKGLFSGDLGRTAKLLLNKIQSKK